MPVIPTQDVCPVLNLHESSPTPVFPRYDLGSTPAQCEKIPLYRRYSEDWRLSRPCSGVNNQGRTPSRPLILEDDPPGESRFRRVQAGVPPIGRPLPGMPQGPSDPDDDVPLRFGGSRFGQPPSPWWRPAGAVGRVLLGLGVLAVLGSIAAAAFAFKTYLGRDSRFRIAGTGNVEAIGLSQVSREEM